MDVICVCGMLFCVSSVYFRLHNVSLPLSQSDLDHNREVNKGEGDILAKEWQCPFFETSAKDRVNIDETFHELVRRMKRFQSSITAGDKGKSKKKGCLMM